MIKELFPEGVGSALKCDEADGVLRSQQQTGLHEFPDMAGGLFCCSILQAMGGAELGSTMKGGDSLPAIACRNKSLGPTLTRGIFEYAHDVNCSFFLVLMYITCPTCWAAEWYPINVDTVRCNNVVHWPFPQRCNSTLPALRTPLQGCCTAAAEKLFAE